MHFQFAKDFRNKFIFETKNSAYPSCSHYLMSLRQEHRTLNFMKKVVKETKGSDDFLNMCILAILMEVTSSNMLKRHLNLLHLIRFWSVSLKKTGCPIPKKKHPLYRSWELPSFQYNDNLRSNPASDPVAPL